MREPVLACVGLGANLGDPVAQVRWALDALAALPDSRFWAASGLYRTAPWEADGPDFINAVAQVETRLSAPALLRALQALEARAGRERPYRNAPRTLDLDLLFYGDAVVQSPDLVLPHPRWQERAFVLHPLAELLPGRVSPADLARVADQAIARLP